MSGHTWKWEPASENRPKRAKTVQKPKKKGPKHEVKGDNGRLNVVTIENELILVTIAKEQLKIAKNSWK